MMIYKDFISGEWMSPRSSQALPNVNPARTNDVIGKRPLSPGDEAQAAIATSDGAGWQWRPTPASVRWRMVARAGRRKDAAQAGLAALLTQGEDKALSETRGEIRRSFNIHWRKAGLIP